MEGAADGDEAEGAGGACRERLGAPFLEAQASRLQPGAEPGRFGRRPGGRDHLGLGIDAENGAGVRGEGQGQEARPAAEIEQAGARVEPAQRRHPVDQGRRIGHPVAGIEGGRRAKPPGMARRREPRRSRTSRPCS